MSDIVWEEPIETHGRGRRPGIGKWVQILQPLLKRPDKWARVAETPNPKMAHNAARSLRNRYVKIPPGRWNFAARATEDDKGYVYARYLGPEE